MGRDGQRKSSAVDPIWSELALQVVLSAYPARLIQAVVADAGRAEQRDRLLNATLLVRFVLALPLFPGLGYRDVLRRVLHALHGEDVHPTAVTSSPALSKGRRRLGVEVFEELFRRSVADRTTACPLRDWAGRSVLIAGESTLGAGGDLRAEPGTPPLVLHTLRSAGSDHVLAAGMSDQRRPPDRVWQTLLSSVPGAILLVADHLHGASALFEATAERPEVELLWQPAATIHFLAEHRLADGSVTGTAALRTAHGAGRERPARVLDKLGGSPLPIADRLGDRLMTTIVDSDGAPSWGLISLHRSSTAGSGATARYLESLAPRARDRSGVEQETWAFLLVQAAMQRAGR